LDLRDLATNMGFTKTYYDATAYAITGPRLWAVNTGDNPENVSANCLALTGTHGYEIKNETLKLNLPAHSVYFVELTAHPPSGTLFLIR